MRDSYWLKSGVLTLLQRLFIVLFGFIGFYVLIRIFTKEEYGIWMLFISVTTVAEVLKQGLIKNATVKYIVSSSEIEKPQVLSASLILNAIITGVIVVVLVSIAPFLSIKWNAPELDYILKIYAITSIIYIFFYHFEYIQQAHFNFKGTFVSYFVKQGLFLLYILVLFFLNKKPSIINLAVAQVVTVFISMIISFFYAKQYLRFQLKIDKAWIMRIFNYGKYTFGTNLSTMIFGNIDQWMLAYIISPISVAIYNPAVRISNLVEVPTLSIASIVFPKISERLKEQGKEGAKYLYEKSVGVILALLMPGLLFIVIFTDFVIAFIAGENYTETIPILQVTILFSIFVPFARQFGTLLDGIGLPKVNFYFIMSQAALNIVFNYFFITAFGVLGAAIGTLCTYFIGFVFNQIYLYKLIRTNPRNVVVYALNFYKEIFFYITKSLGKYFIFDKK